MRTGPKAKPVKMAVKAVKARKVEPVKRAERALVVALV